MPKKITATMGRMILSLLVGLSLPASAASGLFEKTPAATNAFRITFSGDTTDSRATAYALQGLVNRSSAEVYINDRSNDFAQLTNCGKPYTTLTQVGGTYSGLKTLFKKYSASVQRMFIYEPTNDWTFYLAFMAGAQSNGIPVTDAVRAALQAQVPGWAGTVVDYRNIGTSRVEGYDWALTHLMPNCTKKSVYFARSFDLDVMDYVASSKSFVFNLTTTDAAQSNQISQIFGTPGYGVGTSLGGYAGDSVNRLANPYGIGYNVSDFYSNGSFWSSFPDKTYTQRAGQSVIAQNGKVYVAILLSDGDNLQFDQGDIYTIWKNDPARGTVPVGTSLSPVLQEINTPLLDWYYTNKTANDELMAGPCGVQFIYLDDYDSALLPQWCEINARWTADAGFSTASVWKGTYPSANYDVYTAMSGVDNIRHNANLFSLSSNPQITNGVLVFNERIRDCTNATMLYQDLSAVATNASAPIFATGKLITPRFSGTNFSAVKSVIDQLNANFPGKYVFQLPMDQAATAREYFQPNRTWNTGNGTWDTSTANWLNSASNSATFANNVHAVVFGDAAGVTNNPVITLNSTVTPLHVKVQSTNHNYTLSGAGGIGGNTSLILDPANTKTLTLSSANTYTGDTTVNSGTLALGAGGRLGNGNYAGDIRMAGGAFLNIQTTSSQTLSGAITGTGTLRQSGGSDLILTGSAGNTINNLSITGGRVFINNAKAITSSTTTTIGANGILNLGAAPTTIGAITVQNNGGIATRVTAGTTLANVTLPGPGTAIFNNDDAKTYPLTISSDQTLSGNLTVQIGGGRNTANAVGGVTLSGILGGPGGLIVKGNTNTLTLAGANTYTGNTTVSSGMLVITQPTFAPGSTISIASNAVLKLNFTTTNVVGALVLNGVNKAPGVYNNVSGAPFITGAGSLQVAAPAPTLTSVTPNPVTGSTYAVTLGLTGSGFTGASAVLLTNVTATTGGSYSPTVNSDTNITVSFVPGTAASSWNATVVNGTPSAPVGFTVTVPPAVSINQNLVTSAGAGKVVLSGTGGAPGNRYAVVNATNLTPPVVWSPIVTNTFDGSGNFSYTNTVNPGTPQLFLRLAQ